VGVAANERGCCERAEIWLARRSNGQRPARPGIMFLEAYCAASCNAGGGSLAI
jgi:hypothetical protein